MKRQPRSHSGASGLAPEHAGAGRRMAPRVPVMLDCLVHWGVAEFEGSLLDLSTGGASVGLPPGSQFPVGDPLVLDLATDDGVLSVPAHVVSAEDESFASSVLRMKFDAGSPELQRLIEDCTAGFRERQADIFRRF